VALAGLLFGYVATRAALIPITWDEVYNYLEFTRKGTLLPFGHFRAMAANNHWLNTWLTWLTTSALGVAELTLRIPALVAYGLYLYHTARLSTVLSSPLQRASAFVVLNGNPYMLDFFSLSRGYGLAYGLMAGSLWHLYRYFREGGRSRDGLASLGFAVLAVAAHLTLIHFLLALLAVFVLAGLLLAPAGLGTPGRVVYTLRSHALPLVLVGVSLVPAAFVVRKLRQAHAFFYGGTTGFWRDTLVGSANAWLYQERRPGIPAECLAALVVLLMAAAVVAAVRSIRRRSNTRDLYLPALVFLVTTCALASVVQHHVLGVLYLSSRTATHLVILVAWILVVLAGERSRTSRSWRLALPLVAAAVVLNLIGSLNLSSVLEWRVSADVKRMLADVAAARRAEPPPSHPTVLGIGLDLEAPINFYRLVDGLTWLNVADRRMKSPPLSDFYLYSEADWRSVDADSFVVLDGYRAGNSRLLRRKVRPSGYQVVIRKQEDYEGPADSLSAPGMISEALAYRGSRSGFTDRRHRRSGGISFAPNLTGDAADSSLILVKAMVWMESVRNATARLVVVFERNGKPYSWQSMTLQDVATRARTWFPAELTAFVPQEARPGDEVSVYLENRRGTVDVDDLEMRWLRAVWTAPAASAASRSR